MLFVDKKKTRTYCKKEKKKETRERHKRHNRFGPI